MKKHTKIYLDEFDFVIDDFIPCEICAKRAVDVHHIEARGMGGSKSADEIENLMALCRTCHTEYGDIVEFKDMLKQIHQKHLDNRESNN